MGRQFTVLLVEDHSGIRDAVGVLLREHGFRVLLAGDGGEAVRLLAEHRVDLLFTDIAMPGINGFDLAQLAKTMCPGLSVLCITGDTEGARGKGMLYGRILLKPVRADEILAAVTQALVG
jgi:CheY-like chemotaxis protein